MAAQAPAPRIAGRLIGVMVGTGLLVVVIAVVSFLMSQPDRYASGIRERTMFVMFITVLPGMVVLSGIATALALVIWPLVHRGLREWAGSVRRAIVAATGLSALLSSAVIAVALVLPELGRMSSDDVNVVLIVPPLAGGIAAALGWIVFRRLPGRSAPGDAGGDPGGRGVTPLPPIQSGPSARDPAAVILQALGGYVIAVGVGVAGFLGLVWLVGTADLGVLDLVQAVARALPFALVLAFPGFVLIRLALWFARRRDRLSFAVGGAVNGLAIFLVLFASDVLSGAGPQVTPNLVYLWPMVLGGFVAGLVCWAVERLLSRRLPGQPW
ncbi:MAG: hypothetical protein MUF73_07075 [Rhodobacteraceae bacterium]|jgi:hypothetical protein|nr:hypothetical protein [Paracoccaceae bacterium]